MPQNEQKQAPNSHETWVCKTYPLGQLCKIKISSFINVRTGCRSAESREQNFKKRLDKREMRESMLKSRLESSLYMVLFNPREYTVFDLREWTERTERD